MIKALPRIHPQVETFCFPYIQFAGKYVVNEEFRIRLSRNLPSIQAIFDAWSFGLSKEFLRKKKLKAFANPHRLSGYLDKGISFVYANVCMDKLSRAVYLHKPMFRYWSLFPKNFLEKCQKHSEYFHWPEFDKSFELLQSKVDKPEVFWREGSEFLRKVEFNELGLNYPEEFSIYEAKEHPGIMQEFISNPNAEKYYIREELMEQIKNL